MEVDELDPRESGPALRRADVDVAVTADLLDGALLAGPDVATVPLLEDPVVLVTARGDQAPVNRATSRASPTRRGQPTSLGATCPRSSSACREAGFEPRVVARLPSYELLLAHVEAGLSVALLPGLAVDPRYAVDARPLRVPRTRPVYAAVRRGAAPTAATTAVLGALRRVAREVAGHTPPGTG